MVVYFKSFFPFSRHLISGSSLFLEKVIGLIILCNCILHFLVSPCNGFPIHIVYSFETKSNSKQRKHESTSLSYQCQSNQFNETQKPSHMNLKCSPRIANKQILSSLSLLRALKGCFIVLFRFLSPRAWTFHCPLPSHYSFTFSLSLALKWCFHVLAIAHTQTLALLLKLLIRSFSLFAAKLPYFLPPWKYF